MLDFTCNPDCPKHSLRALSMTARHLQTPKLRNSIPKTHHAPAQEKQLASLASKASKPLPADLDYSAIATLSMEAREKLGKVGQSRWRRRRAGAGKGGVGLVSRQEGRCGKAQRVRDRALMQLLLAGYGATGAAKVQHGCGRHVPIRLRVLWRCTAGSDSQLCPALRVRLYVRSALSRRCRSGLATSARPPASAA